MEHVVKCQDPCITGNFDAVVFYSLLGMLGEIVALILDLFSPTTFKGYFIEISTDFRG